MKLNPVKIIILAIILLAGHLHVLSHDLEHNETLETCTLCIASHEASFALPPQTTSLLAILFGFTFVIFSKQIIFPASLSIGLPQARAPPAKAKNS